MAKTKGNSQDITFAPNKEGVTLLRITSDGKVLIKEKEVATDKDIYPVMLHWLSGN